MTDVVIPLSKKGTVKVYTQAYVDKQQKQIAELKERNSELAGQKASLGRWFNEACSIIREYVRIAHEEFSNEFDARFANRDLLEKAEAFLKEAMNYVI